jgi:hypothetical protein
LRKIFYYQCRRLLCNKLFWGLLAVTLWYSREVLYGTVIRGVCNTAPFSPWSFGYYLTFLLPFLCAAELFFLSFYTSPAERRVEVLASATPVSPRHYSFSRWGALAVGTGLLTLLILLMAGAFYARMFRWDSFGELLAPAVFVLVPALLFFLGAGWFLGNLRHVLLYPLIALPFLCAYLPLPRWLDPVGGRFFLTYPLELGVLDPGFSLPPDVLWGRVGLSTLGLLLLFLTRKKRG